MTTTSFANLGPIAVCILGALLCLFLEAAGTPAGARKRGTRLHLVLVAVLVLVASLVQLLANWRDLLDVSKLPPFPSSSELLFDGPSRFGMVALILLVLMAVLAQFPAGPNADLPSDAVTSARSRGEVTALLLIYAAVGMVFLSTDRLLTLTVACAAIGILNVGLVALDDGKTKGAEAAAKETALMTINVVLLSLSTALAYTLEVTTFSGLIQQAVLGNALAKTAVVSFLIALGTWLPLVPLHSVRMDVASGAPSFAAGLLTSSGLLFGGTILLRSARELSVLPFAAADAEQLIAVASVVVIAVPSVAALDQQRIFRAVLYLILGFAGLLLPVLATAGNNGGAQEERIALLLAHGALVSFGALVAVAVFEKPNLGSTWEDWSGLGRNAPLPAALLLILLASVIGLPGTFGFSLRLDVAMTAFSEQRVWVGGVVLLTPVAGLAAVSRLTLFLFSKIPRNDAEIEVGRLRLLIMLLCAGIALFGGLGYESMRTLVGWLLG